MKRLLTRPVPQACWSARPLHTTVAPAMPSPNVANKQQPEATKSTDANKEDTASRDVKTSSADSDRITSKKKKTTTELDDELREKMETVSGGGAGVEYENGKAVGLKRGVKENMFRVI